MASQLISILSNLGFQELAVDSRFLSLRSDQYSPPLAIFAASDESIRSCSDGGATCSDSLLLEEHMVPGLFSHLNLSKLSFGTKLETISTNRCLTVTSTVGSDSRPNSTVKIFIDGLQITHPDLFNDGKVIVHGIQGFIAPLTPFSCITDKSHSNQSHSASTVMLRDVIIRLRSSGYGELALALEIKSPELVTLQNMTIFAMDYGGWKDFSDVKFHLVPNQLLMYEDLMKLPVGTVLPTLIKGDNIVITQTAAGPGSGGLRINFTPLLTGDVLSNSKIAIHSLHFPLPYLYSSGRRGGVCGVGAVWNCWTMKPSISPAYGSSSAAHSVRGDDSF